MVLMSASFDQCCCIAPFSRFPTRRPELGAIRKNSSRSSIDLPSSIDLAPKLAAELRQVTGNDDPGACAVGGVAGPIIAVVFGVMDGLGSNDQDHKMVSIAIRRELRVLARFVGDDAAGLTSPQQSKDTGGKSKFGIDSHDLLFEWCASPAVPTYHTGVHIALGDLDAESKRHATDLAWVFRVMCHRMHVDARKEVPMFAMVCEALCGSGNTLEDIQGAIQHGRAQNRSASLSHVSCFPDAEETMTRSVSDQHLISNFCAAAASL